MALIQNIVARFTADSTGFDRNLKRSRTSLKATQQSMLGLQRSVLRLAGGYLGARGLVRALKSVTAAAMEQEVAERKVYAALNLVGDASAENMGKIKVFASEIQSLTTYGDELVLRQMAIGKAMGMATGQLGEGTVAAVGLAAAYDKDLATSMRIVALAAQGETTQLKRMGIIIDQNLSPQEKYNEVVRRGAEAFRLAYEEAQTAAGAIKQSQNRIGDVQEAIGARLLPTYALSMKTIAGYLEANQKDMAAWAQGTISIVGAVVTTFMKAQAKIASLTEKFSAPGLIQKTATERYLQEFPEDRRVLEQWKARENARRFAGAPSPTKPDLTDPGRLEEIKAQLRRETEAVWKEQEELRKMILTRPLTGEYKVPSLNIARGETAAGGTQALNEAASKAIEDRITATARMYGEIGSMSEAATTAQIARLDQQREAYEEMGIDQVAITEWYTGMIAKMHEKSNAERDKTAATVDRLNAELKAELEIIGLLPDSQERATKAAAMHAGAMEKFGGDMEQVNAVMAEYKTGLDDLYKRNQLVELAQSVGDSFVQNFTLARLAADDLGQSLQNLAMDVAELVWRQTVTQPMANAISSGITSMFTPTSNTPLSPPSSSYPNEAGRTYGKSAVLAGPKLLSARDIGGDVWPEAPRPLARGGRDRDGAISFKVDIHNESGTALEAESQGGRFDGGDYIADVIVRAERTGAPWAKKRKGGFA